MAKFTALQMYISLLGYNFHGIDWQGISRCATELQNLSFLGHLGWNPVFYTSPDCERYNCHHSWWGANTSASQSKMLHILVKFASQIFSLILYKSLCNTKSCNSNMLPLVLLIIWVVSTNNHSLLGNAGFWREIFEFGGNLHNFCTQKHINCV